MTIKPGDRLPNVEFTVTTADGPQKFATDVIFAGRKVVLFGLPGAFTPTCNMNHLPGYLLAHDDMLADGNGEFAKAVGLELDLTAAGMGPRSQRYSMIVEDGVVKSLNVETERGVNVSGAETILQQLKA
jgi:peroxiredoxin